MSKPSYERERAVRTVMEVVFALRKIGGKPNLKDLVKLAKRIKHPSSFHAWGDGFPYFAEVGEAAYEIGEFCRRWGRIGVMQTKEKYGTARVYAHFGIHQMFSLTHPGYAYNRYPKWLWFLDCTLIANIFRFLRINYLIVPYQKFIYRLAYKRALKKYPMIRDEILDGADYSEYLTGL